MPHSKLLDLLEQTDIPVIVAPQECYDVSSRFHSMTVKIQPQDMDKFAVIKKLIMYRVDMKQLLAAF